tara:strand:- start:1073 stop:1795 length:723 start_codon:yes stop_codon:yes gene_type:complete
MAGHSKWANIQHRKGAQDAKRSKIFTKLIREITVAARLFGGDLDSNPRLKVAIDKAKGANMPKDTIEKAVKKGAEGLDGDNMESIRYEGYGPSGIAIIVDCLTDNKNRTVGEVRHAFTKFGGNLGTDGSVSYMFKKQGIIRLDNSSNEEVVMELALDAGAEDVCEVDDGFIEVITSPENFDNVKDILSTNNHNVVESDLSFIPDNYTPIDDEEIKERILKLLNMIDDLDDVQEIYHNAEF